MAMGIYAIEDCSVEFSKDIMATTNKKDARSHWDGIPFPSLRKKVSTHSTTCIFNCDSAKMFTYN